ncbi:MAG: TetR/AcrR family transcriptional regulator [Halioglobus sp.]
MTASKQSLVDTRENILREAVQLFANAGYDGVSMRELGRRVGVRAATLYHHFPDKESLYLAAVARAFENTRQALLGTLVQDAAPNERLEKLVDRFVALISEDVTFRKLLLRELIDVDDARLALLARHVFRDIHQEIVALARELTSDLDPYLFSNSLVGMVLYSIQSAPLRRHLGDDSLGRDGTDMIARHVYTVLRRACTAAEET